MRQLLGLTALLLGSFACGAVQSKQTRQKVCTNQLEQQAEKQALRSTLRDWAAVHESYKKFGVCNDGVIAEGYSDAVAQLLAKHWNTLPDLIRFSSSDPTFKEFVLRHIDATDSDDDLKAADRNARLHCPSEARSLCSAIRSHAGAAIKDINEDTD